MIAAFLVALATLGAAGRNAATDATVKNRTADLENELSARRGASGMCPVEHSTRLLNRMIRSYQAINLYK